jgi:hypothetical protein
VVKPLPKPNPIERVELPTGGYGWRIAGEPDEGYAAMVERLQHEVDYWVAECKRLAAELARCGS